MNAQQTPNDVARLTIRAGGRGLDSILRALTISVALLVFGVSAPMVVADHMGNHERALKASAQGGPPPSDATPGAVGFKGAILGGVDSAAAPGFRLEIRESVWEPGAYVTSHFHPVAIVVCVQSGALGFAIQDGAATVSRGGTEGTPESIEPLTVGVEAILEPRDCVTFDEYALHTSHTAWNASEGQTVLWEAALLKIGETYTTFLDAQGTPVP